MRAPAILTSGIIVPVSHLLFLVAWQLSVGSGEARAQATAKDPLLGFTAERAAAQLERERAFAAALRAEDLERWMSEMTRRPHHVGSAQVKANAEHMRDLFTSWGYETEIVEYRVLFPTPRIRRLELLEPRRFQAALTEPAVRPGDVGSAITEEGLPPFNAYAHDGDVTGELVYVHHGVPDDYEELERRGIDVRGKIVIARYGGSWRGIKPKIAAEKGAIGCLIYNDPGDDGYAEGGAYPDGPFKHGDAVQRGSVIDLPVRPGDPLTPGYGATADAKRKDRSEVETIMSIPVLPISWSDARPLLEALGGQAVPEAWRGGLPITYRTGPGPAKVRLHVEFDWKLVPAYNVIATLRGGALPDQWVIRGNHHDAWVVGARDPISGMVTVLAQAQATSRLVESGWRPRRTIVFCAWDAEEPGLLGSTEWVEDHADVLREKAVAYINTDGNSRGFLSIGGTHALERMANQVANAVDDPQTGVSVGERLRSAILIGGPGAARDRAEAGGGLRLSALGSGSDYSAFLQHLGIPTFNVGFGGEGRGGEYHTNFDTFDHYSRFIDPGFAYGLALTRTCGLLTLRLADADLLPFDFRASAAAIGSYVDEVVELADSVRDETERRNRLIAEGHFERATDPMLTYVPPTPEAPVPYLNFAPLLNARRELDRSAAAYGQALDRFQNAATAGSIDMSTATGTLRDVDHLLFASERQLTTERGLPGRPWFRHQIYAPGLYTGYGVKTLPGVREGIEQRRWDLVSEQILVTAEVVQRFADQIDRAAGRLASAPLEETVLDGR